MSNEVLSWSFNCLLLSGYTLLFSAVLYALCRLLTMKIPTIVGWRAFWLTATLLCLLPMVCGLAPNPFHRLSEFNLDSLVVVAEPDTLAQRNTLGQGEAPPAFLWFSMLSYFWMAIYAAGLMARLSIIFKQWLQLKRRLRHSTSLVRNIPWLDRKQRRYLNRIEQHCGIQLLLTEQVHSPFVVQTPQTTLVLPRYIFEELTATQCRLVIQHEWQHIQSKDGLVQLLVQILLCANWFNPIAYWLVGQMNWAVEATCDRNVLNNKRNLQRIYALAMLKILRRSATDYSEQLVAAFSSKSQRRITMRINHILAPSDRGFKSFFSRVGLTGGAATLSLAVMLSLPSVQAAQTHPLLNPVKLAHISSPYGERNQFHEFHHGIDLAAPTGTAILAPAAGKVIVSTEHLKGKKGFGTVIIIDHGNGLQSVYSHLSQRDVMAGEEVKQGQQIGLIGATGRVTGPHLHLEIHQNNQAVDPAEYIDFKS